jgi:hypothetical protein
MSPATHALDRRLHELRTAHESVKARLADLDGDHIYALLVAGHGFSGATADVARPAVARLADLRESAAPLSGLLASVLDERQAGPLDDRRAAELVAWLNSPSIMVPSSGPRASERPLVPAPHGAEVLSAQGVLQALDEAIDRLREVITTIDGAWQGFGDRLERVSAEADAVAAQLPGNRALAAARGDLGLLATRVIGDPLGAIEVLDLAEAAIAAADSVRDESRPLHDRLAACRRTAADIEAAVVAGRHGLDRSRAEFVAPAGMFEPLDPAVLTGERGLLPWLGRLERLVEEGEVGLATTGLDRWEELAAQTLAAARQVAEANVGPTKRRRELRGLLRAARVKAGASGRAEDPWATELADRAEAALAIPCNLAEAEAQVDAFLDDLRLSPTPAQGADAQIARARAAREERARSTPPPASRPGPGPGTGAGGQGSPRAWGMSA